MIRYRNHNTGDVVERSSEDARLEMLPNWERLGDDEKADPAVERDGVLTRPQASPGTVATDPGSPQAEAEAEFKEQQEEAGDPPAKSAPKDEWIAYAEKRAVSDQEREEIPGLTKDMLIAKYGESSA